MTTLWKQGVLTLWGKLPPPGYQVVPGKSNLPSSGYTPQRIKHSPRWTNSFPHLIMKCHPDTVFSLPWPIRELAFIIHFYAFSLSVHWTSEGKDSVVKWRVLFPLEIKGHNSMEWYWAASSSDLCPWDTDGIHSKRWKISKSEVEEQGTNMFNWADLQPHRSNPKMNILSGIS